VNAVTRSRLSVAFAAVFLTGTVGLAAAPASASTGTPSTAALTQIVQFSSDGIHWSDSYTGALFGGVLLVPGGSADRALYIRNGASDSAILAVTLFDVTTTATELADALSLTASTPGFAGTAVAITSARPCVTLTEGQVLGSGDSIRLDTLATLADLNGTAGQGATAAFKLAITLRSTDASAPAPNTCPADSGTGGGTVIGIPDPPTTAGSSTEPTLYHLGGAGWTSIPSTGPGSTAGSAGGTGVVAAPTERGLVANTERLYQENYVAYWLAMAVLGALLVLIVRRRRNDNPSSQYSPTEKIGTGR
jgi:hypothetical protein